MQPIIGFDGDAFQGSFPKLNLSTVGIAAKGLEGLIIPP
jgi:hypothetical protein